MKKKDDLPIRHVAAPLPLRDRPATGPLSVALKPNEDVEWHWVHGPEGSHVNGYTILKKGRPVGTAHFL